VRWCLNVGVCRVLGVVVHEFDEVTFLCMIHRSKCLFIFLKWSGCVSLNRVGVCMGVCIFVDVCAMCVMVSVASGVGGCGCGCVLVSVCVCTRARACVYVHGVRGTHAHSHTHTRMETMVFGTS